MTLAIYKNTSWIPEDDIYSLQGVPYKWGTKLKNWDSHTLETTVIKKHIQLTLIECKFTEIAYQLWEICGL